MQTPKTFSLNVLQAILPKPTVDMLLIVKYKAKNKSLNNIHIW